MEWTDPLETGYTSQTLRIWLLWWCQIHNGNQSKPPCDKNLIISIKEYRMP